MNSYNPNEYCGYILSGNSSKIIVNSSTIVINSEELNEFAFVDGHRLKLAHRRSNVIYYVQNKMKSCK